MLKYSTFKKGVIMIKEKMFATRIDSEILKRFSKACRSLGFKQNAIIEGYMKHIIDRAEKVEELKNLDFKTPIDLYHNTDRLEILMSSENKKNESNNG
jgi:antitoxin component of RelBE/YafQ-DinJ toxin-antitoxin module